MTRFITGINGLPYGGIRSVCHKRQIEVKDGDFPVPSSATCFYTLTLPTDVTSSDDLLDRIKISLSGSLRFEDSWIGFTIDYTISTLTFYWVKPARI